MWNLRVLRSLQPYAVAVALFIAAFGISSIVFRPHVAAFSDLSNCFPSSRGAVPSEVCIRKTVDTLLTTYSTGDMMSYLMASTTLPQIAANCHPYAHVVGEETYKLSNSMEQALTRCTSSCRYGCQHGVLAAGVLDKLGQQVADEEDLAHANTAEIEKIGKRYCDEEAALCHGIGHLLYILSSGDANVLSVCADIATEFRKEACYQGFFMERTGNENSLFPFGTTSPLLVPGSDTCQNLAPKYRHSCFQFLPLFKSAQENVQGETGTSTKLQLMTHFCQSLPQPDRSSCIEGVGVNSRVYGYKLANPVKLQSMCDQFPVKEDRDACTLGILPRFMFQDYPLHSMIAYCHLISEGDRRNLCYRSSFEWLPFPSDQESRLRICGTDNLAECTEQYKAFSALGSHVIQYHMGLFGGN